MSHRDDSRGRFAKPQPRMKNRDGRGDRRHSQERNRTPSGDRAERNRTPSGDRNYNSVRGQSSFRGDYSRQPYAPTPQARDFAPWQPSHHVFRMPPPPPRFGPYDGGYMTPPNMNYPPRYGQQDMHYIDFTEPWQPAAEEPWPQEPQQSWPQEPQQSWPQEPVQAWQEPVQGDNVLEKAENLVSHLEQKRRSLTEDKGRRNKNLNQMQNEYVKSSYNRSSVVNTVPRPSGSKGLIKPGDLTKSLRTLQSTTPNISTTENTTEKSIRNFSPSRTALVKPNIKATRSGSSDEPLSRACIAKLINAPRSHKEKQRLASLVKKTKPKSIRPKLNVQQVPELGAQVDPVACEVSDMLDLVDLPESLRLKVESLLENGPENAIVSLQTQSPVKSPSPKRPKTDFQKKPVPMMKLEPVSDITAEYLNASLALSHDFTQPEPILSSTHTETEIIRIKDEPTWDNDSVVSDVTSLDQSEAEERRPFEKVAESVTLDPKLNALLTPKPVTIAPVSSQSPERRPASSQNQRTDSPDRRQRKSPLRRSTEPVTDTREVASVVPIPSQDPLQASISRLQSTLKETSVGRTPKRPEQTTKIDQSETAIPMSQSVPSSSTSQSPGTRQSNAVKTIAPNHPATNPSSETSTSNQGNGGVTSSNHVASPMRTDAPESENQLATPSRRTELPPDAPLSDVARNHPISTVAGSLQDAANRMRDVGDSLMYLHVAIHSAPKPVDTVNLVLDITEKEEQLAGDLEALDSHTAKIAQLICESQTELDRLRRLRESVRGDGEILRKRRLEVLRDAVSKKRTDENEPSFGSPSTHAQTSQNALQEPKPSAESQETGNSGSTRSENSSTPSDTNGNEEPVHMQYVGSINLEELGDADLGSHLWENLQADDMTSYLVSDAAEKFRNRLHESSDVDKIKFPKFKKKKKQKAEKPEKAKPKAKEKIKASTSNGKKSTNLKKQKLGRKKKLKPSVTLLAYRDLETLNLVEKSAKGELGHHDLDVSSVTDVTTDVDDRNEGLLDNTDKVKSALLKALHKEEEMEQEAISQRKKFKHRLLESTSRTEETRTPQNVPDPIMQCDMIDREIAMKLKQCTVVLEQLQESKIKELEKKRKSKKSKKVQAPTTSMEDCASSGTVTPTESDKKGKKKQKESKAIKLVGVTKKAAKNSPESSEDELPIRIRPPRRRENSQSSQLSFASDTRKEKLRKMGVILSASELEEYCKDGHNLSDMESLNIETPRTEDLPLTEDMIDTPRTDITVTTLSSATPIDDSDNYSSCLESMDEAGLRTTGENFMSKLLDSQRTEVTDDLLDTPRSDINLDTPRTDELLARCGARPISEKHEIERIKDRSDDTDESGGVSVSSDVKAYQQRVSQYLDCDSDSGKDRWQLATDGDSSEEVIVLGESEADEAKPTRVPSTEPVAEPVSARSIESEPPQFGRPQRLKFEGHTTAVTSMVIHDQYLYTCSPQDAMIRKFSLETAKCLHIFEGPTESVYTMIALDHGGKSYLYTGGYDCKLIKYDLKTNECLSEQTLSEKVRCFVSKWDKLYIGLTSGEVLSLNLDNETTKSLICGDKTVSCMDAGIEGSRHVLVVGTFDPLISIHDAKNGILLRTIASHSRVPLSVKVYHNLIYSAGADKCVKLHDMNSGELIRSVKLQHPVTDLQTYKDHILVACFDGIVRNYSKDLDLQRLYYGAGKSYLLRLLVRDGKLYSTNKNGLVESFEIEDVVYRCQVDKCSLAYGLISDLEYHVTERHIDSRLEGNVPVYVCSWLGCCYETLKKMELENHLLNHVENVESDDF